MEKRLIRPVAISLALFVVIAQAFPAYCCGPFFPDAVYSYWNHPDLPLKKFAQGQLGIVQPMLANSYLVVAYRYLTDKPLDAAEQQAAIDLWHQRLSTNPDSIDSSEWLAIRNTVPGVKKLASKDIETYANQSGVWQSYQNCSLSAMHTAAETLKARIAKYGVTSNEVRLWVENQDKVFQNCGGEKKGNVVLPEKPGPNADALAQQDFAYQTAAANFYAGATKVAMEQFEKIAADKESPWSGLAAYLQARTLVRNIALAEFSSNETVPPDPKQIEEAQNLVSKLLAEKALADYHADLQSLSNQLTYRTDPMTEYHRLVTAVLRPNSGKAFQGDLDDYTNILPILSSKPVTKTDNADQSKTGDAAVSQDSTSDNQPSSPPAECLKDDLTDWLYNFKAGAKSDAAHAVEKWKSTKSLPWLIAALQGVKGSNADAEALIKEAQAVPTQSPAYLSAQYFSIRLLASKNEKDEARKALDQLLTQKSTSMPPSSKNLLIALRQTLARDYSECIGYGLKQPVAQVVDPSDATLPDDFDKIEKQDQYPAPLPAAFDQKMVAVLNEQLPLALWDSLSQDERLSAKQRSEVVSAAWIRALLLGNNDLALKLTPMMETSYPSLKPLLASFQTAKTPSERRFSACYVMLKAPGLSPYIRGGLGRVEGDVRDRDDYGDNFWTPTNPDEKPQTPDYSTDDSGYSDPALVKPDLSNFLTADQKTQSLKERRTMYSVASPPRFITEAVLAWSKESPSDPRLPEALFRSVKMPRWGCRVPNSTGYSKAAYMRLHSNYPSSSWAKKAEYYY